MSDYQQYEPGTEDNDEYEYADEYIDENEPIRKKRYVPSMTFIIILILICLGVIYSRTILPGQLYDKAKRDYDAGHYTQAYKIFNVFALINPFDEEVIEYQVKTLQHLPSTYTNQKKLYEISQYDDAGAAEELARDEVLNLKQKIMQEAGDNYIESVLFNNRVIRWNLDYKPISFYISVEDSNIPDYYRTKVYNSFAEWTDASGQLVTFKEIQSKEAADILVVLSNSVPESVQKYFDKYQVGNTYPILKNDNLKQMVINIKTRNENGTFHLDSEFANIIKHEIGHALGIWGHSSRQNDVMFYRADNIMEGAREKSLSYRDINTLKLLYRLAPDTINVELSADELEKMIYHYIVTKTSNRSSENEIRQIMEELNANRNDISKWVDLAIEYSINERYAQSNTILFKALPLINRDVNNLHIIYYNIAANYYYLHQYREAENYINRARRLRSDYDTRALGAFINYKLGKYVEAERELSELFTQKPSNIEVAIKLADLYRKANEIDKSKEVISELIKYNPDAKYDRRVLKYKVGKVYWGLATGV